ncbi:MAG: CpaF family protein [Actinomycetota bacterium]
MERDGLEILARSVAPRAGQMLAQLFPGKALTDLGEAEKARAEPALLRFCDQVDQERSAAGQTPLRIAGQKLLAEYLWDELFDIGAALAQFCDDRQPDCEEVCVDVPSKGMLRRSGNRVEVFQPGLASDEELRSLITRIVEIGGGRIDDASPYVTVHLPNGCRVTAVVAISSHPRLTIRVPRLRVRSLQDLVDAGTIDELLAAFLMAAVIGRLNIVVTGATFSGKTTFVQALCTAIPGHERVVTIEEDPELQLDQIVAHAIDLRERPESVEGVGAITMRQLVRLSLRMTPDRIMVGEVRGAEAVEMLLAMNSGHAGSFCTVHADEGRRGLSKLEMYVTQASGWTPRAAKELIAENVDLLIHLREDRELGRRVVSEVVEVTGCENGEVITTSTLFARRAGELRWSGMRPRRADRLEAAGWRMP